MATKSTTRAAKIAATVAAFAGVLCGPVLPAAKAAIEYLDGVDGVAGTMGSPPQLRFKRALAPGGADHYFVVALALRGSSTSVSSVTYDGAPLVRIGAQSFPNVCHIELFGGVNPTADGAGHDVVVTLSGGGTPGVAFGLFHFTGVDQIRPTGKYTGTAGLGGQPRLTAGQGPGQWLMVHECHLDSNGVTQANYAVTQEPGWNFAAVVGSWLTGGVPLQPSGTSTPDAGGGNDAQDAAPAWPDAAPVPDAAASDTSDPSADLDAGIPLDAGDAPDFAPASGRRHVELQVGCACRIGSAAEPGGTISLLSLVLAGLCRRWNARRRSR